MRALGTQRTLGAQKTAAAVGAQKTAGAVGAVGALRALAVLALAHALTLGCGDVTSDLVTAPSHEPSPQGSLDAGAAATDGGSWCTGNAECASSDRDLCDTERGRCVECVTDAHCDEIFERCHAALGRCVVPCTGPGTCPWDEPICDAVLGACVECVADTDCMDSTEVCRRSECVG